MNHDDSRSESTRPQLPSTADGGRTAVGAGGTGGWVSWFATTLRNVAEDIQALRKLVRRQAAAREEAESRLLERLAQLTTGDGQAGTEPPLEPRAPAAALSKAQLEALCRLDEAVLHLIRAADPAGSGASGELAPQTSREALAMLQVRVRNLQRSFGLQPVPGEGSRFDDRVHRVHAVCRRSDLPDGVVVEELLPGYLLGDRLVRPAEVVVNRRPVDEDMGER